MAFGEEWQVLQQTKRASSGYKHLRRTPEKPECRVDWRTTVNNESEARGREDILKERSSASHPPSCPQKSSFVFYADDPRLTSSDLHPPT